MKGVLQRISTGLDLFTGAIFSVQKICLLVASAALVIINFLAIVGRYVLNFSFPWFLEVNLILFAFIILIGGNIAVKDDDELKIELFVMKRESSLLIQRMFIDVLGLIVVGFVFVSAFSFVKQAFEVPSYYAILQIPYAYSNALMVVGFALIFFDKLGLLFRRVYRLIAIKDKEKQK